jgi:hypothetical protein
MMRKSGHRFLPSVAFGSLKSGDSFLSHQALERDAKKWAPVFRKKSRENKDS